MQTVSSRIWIHVVDSISFDDNRYAKLCRYVTQKKK